MVCVDGKVFRHLHVNINVCLKSLTVEELVDRRKLQHVGTLQNLQKELERDLAE